ncbi:hypothetical protein BYT27DRAFT_6391689 [Phlegmacium glaucopus]|nr:hypothetical protein BYT27DRAFT_6391689 [Phlegmacium glaucopus]
MLVKERVVGWMLGQGAGIRKPQLAISSDAPSCKPFCCHQKLQSISVSSTSMCLQWFSAALLSCGSEPKLEPKGLKPISFVTGHLGRNCLWSRPSHQRNKLKDSSTSSHIQITQLTHMQKKTVSR